MPENIPPEALLRDLSHQLEALQRRSIRIETRLMRLITALGYTEEGKPIQGLQLGKPDSKPIFFN